jgi:hypothetical protein
MTMINKKLILIKKCLVAPDKIFDYVINISIIISSFFLVSNTPVYVYKYKNIYIVGVFKRILTSIFAAEVVVKVIAFGFVNSSNKKYWPYLLVPWNVVDLYLVLTNIAEIIAFSSPNIHVYKMPILYSCLAMRTLRLLRYINKNDSLKIVINSLMNSIPALISVILVIVQTLLMFGVIGVDFFKGEFYSCSLTESEYVYGMTNQNYNNILNKFDCLNSGGQWVNA